MLFDTRGEGVSMPKEIVAYACRWCDRKYLVLRDVEIHEDNWCEHNPVHRTCVTCSQGRTTGGGENKCCTPNYLYTECARWAPKPDVS